tara:strand:+ start:966 stop:1217 length:252 start_codon:yes stop_codon:yes gene_type:complete
MKTRATKVMNVVTENSETFFNGYSLETNLISSIILGTEDSRKILDLDFREKITREAKVEYIKSKDGTMKCYSPSYDMIAYELN